MQGFMNNNEAASGNGQTLPRSDYANKAAEEIFASGKKAKKGQKRNLSNSMANTSLNQSGSALINN